MNEEYCLIRPIKNSTSTSRVVTSAQDTSCYLATDPCRKPRAQFSKKVGFKFSSPSCCYFSKRLYHCSDFIIFPQGLRIRGLKIYGSTEARSHYKGHAQSHPHAKTRPNTATATRAPEETSPSHKRNDGGASRAWERAGRTRCKSCIPRFAPKFDSKLQGRRVVMSPRVRQEPGVLASQWEAKLQTLISEGGAEGACHSEEVAKTGASTAGENCAQSEKITTEAQIEKSDANPEHADNMDNWNPLECISARNYHLQSGTPGVKQSSESNKSEGYKVAQTSPKYISSRGSVRSPKTGAKISPSSLAAAQNTSRAVSPLKTSQFVDLADYHKHVPQPPKSRIAGLGGASRLKDDENEGKVIDR